jgi:hypothetical protein
MMVKDMTNVEREVNNPEEAYENIPQNRRLAIRYIVSEPSSSWLVGIQPEEENLEADLVQTSGDNLTENQTKAVVILCESSLQSFCSKNSIDIDKVNLDYEPFKIRLQESLDLFQREGLQGPSLSDN